MNTTTAPFNEVAYCDLAKSTSPRTWLWDGFIGPGQLTLFTAFPKSGKTTLLSVLLAKRRPLDPDGALPPTPLPFTPSGVHPLIPSDAGPPTASRVTAASLAGRRVVPGPSAVASEEPADLWLERGRALGFRDDTVFFCRPFAGKPTHQQLEALCERIAKLKDTRGADLVIFDSLIHFLPRGAENNADLLVEAMKPIRRLTEAGLAVVVPHHPSKAANTSAPSARGTVALTGFVDIALELRLVAPRDKHDRRRHLTAWSRFPETPPHLLIELSEDAADYRVLEMPDDTLGDFWPGLRLVLEDARLRLDRAAILRDWPGDHPAPSDITLYRLLETAVARGLLCRDGAGSKGDPYRYWLPQKEAELAADLRCRLDDLTRAQLLGLPPEVRRAAELESQAVQWDEDNEST